MDLNVDISQLVQNQFPAFYKEEGPNFIQFVQAYYEWMENNQQNLTLQDNPETLGLVIGDTITQDMDNNLKATGTIIAISGNVITVLLDTVQQFRCISLCGVIYQVSFSNGKTSYIKETTTPGILFHTRNLLNYSDIDTTLDRFIVDFKEKYLKNIQFDIATNKRLLVKNSLDLYRSKGTDRSIDLFFKLIYGIEADVYYPGDDLFRLSDNHWVIPNYLEVTDEKITVDYVGKQITGVVSGATAFVERYIKRRINGNFVCILYVTNVEGTFITGEQIISSSYKQLVNIPKVLGSLNYIEIVEGGRDFSVGDIVDFSSSRGDKGTGRIASIIDKTGIVQFTFVDGGFGYTANIEPIISESVLMFNNTRSYTNNYYGYFDYVIQPKKELTLQTGFSAIYQVGDNVSVRQSPTWDYLCNATVVTVNSDSLVVRVKEGDFDAAYANGNPINAVYNDTVINLITVSNDVLNYRIGDVVYQGPQNSPTANSTVVYIDPPSKAIGIGQATFTSGQAISCVRDPNIINTVVSTTQQSTVIGYIQSVADQTALGKVMSKPSDGNISVDQNLGSKLNIGDLVFQLTDQNEVLAKATVTKVKHTGSTTTILDVDGITGAFDYTRPIRVGGRDDTGTIYSVKFPVGIIGPNETVANNAIVNKFVASPYAPAYIVPTLPANTIDVASYNYGSNTIIQAVSSGLGANFKIIGINNRETVIVNTDKFTDYNWGNPGTLSDIVTDDYFILSTDQGSLFQFDGANTSGNGTPIQFSNLALNAISYGFSSNPTANAGTGTIASCLSVVQEEIGSIVGIIQTDPGRNYNLSPEVLLIQPEIAAYNKHDYQLAIQFASNTAARNFLDGEIITQTQGTVNQYDIQLANNSIINAYLPTEVVYQGNTSAPTASATITDVFPGNTTIRVDNLSGTFVAGLIYNIDAPTITSNLVSISDPIPQPVLTRGIIQPSSNTSVLFVKRLSFGSDFTENQTIKGTLSGTEATIVAIKTVADTPPIGLNANVTANVVIANGSAQSIQVLDSGFGYTNNQILSFISETNPQANGTGIVVLGAVGLGAGYYMNTKGFLSEDKYIEDNDYYQEYSYDVISKLPFDRYSEMFKKVMHTAGTRVFGSVKLTDTQSVTITVPETSISQTTI